MILIVDIDCDISNARSQRWSFAVSVLILALVVDGLALVVDGRWVELPQHTAGEVGVGRYMEGASLGRAEVGPGIPEAIQGKQAGWTGRQTALVDAGPKT